MKIIYFKWYQTPVWLLMLLLLFLSLSVNNITTTQNLSDTLQSIDPNGYIIYCPCMGRFGNQAEQFLGSLQFAKALNRTLVLPPFIEYVKHKVTFVPFGDYIEVEPLREYHRVITAEEFLVHLAPVIWPESERRIACYAARNFDQDKPAVKGCNPFHGSPFKEFWHHIGVQSFEAGSLYYGPIYTDHNFARDWIAKFSKEKVLAFVGAPSSFPTNSKAVQLQRFVHLSEMVANKAKQYREVRNFARRPYLSLHLRHGTDWERACDLLKDNTHELSQLFSSQQCLGENHSKQLVSYELCMPSLEHIVRSIRLWTAQYEESGGYGNSEPLRHIHIATDAENQTFWLELHKQLPEFTIITGSVTIDPDGQVTPWTKDHSPHFSIDLYLMSYANLFLGNCISSFSAFVSRYRTYALHLIESTHFIAFDQTPVVSHYHHDEL